MKSDNRPALEWRLRVVTSKHYKNAVVSISTVDREGQDVRMWSQEWPTGRPTPSDLEVMATRVADDITTAILTSIGVQGVL